MRHVNPSAKHLAHGKPAKIVDYYLFFFFFFSCSGVVLHLPVHQSPMELKKKKNTCSGSTPNPLVRFSGIGAWGMCGRKPQGF